MVCKMTERVSCSARLPAQSLLAAALFVCAIPAFGEAAATPPQPASARVFTYEAVTVKPDDSRNSFMRFTPDSFEMSGMPLVMVIRTAFGILMDEQIEGLPEWAKSEPISIHAKMDAGTATALEKLPGMERWKQSKSMLQQLLADRFGVRIHHVARDLPIYVLTVSKGGLKMKPSAPGAEANANYASGRIDAHAVSAANLAMNLSSIVGRPIVDKTGLEGGYDFTLEFAPEGADASDPRPSIFTAMEEQLGLKLRPARGPVDVIVIDHIERPAPN